MVRKGGLEPPRPCDHKILNLARLPIPPLSQRGHNRENSEGMSTSFAGAEGLLRQDVYARLDQAGRDGMDVEQLRRQVSAGPGELEVALARLQTEGKAVEVDGRWLASRHTGWTVGLVEKLEEGDALIRPGVRGEPSFFVRKRNLMRAQAGERVLVRPLGKARPWDDRLAEAIVVKILGPGYESLVGDRK